MKVTDINTDHIRLHGTALKAGPILAVVGAAFVGISAALGSGAWNTFWKS